MLKQKVYSQSLKKMKKQQIYDYSMSRLQVMQRQIQRSASSINIKQRPIKNYIQARKQLIQHKYSKNNIQKQVDNIMINLVQNNKLSLLNHNKQINHKHHYQHYRIQTQPIYYQKNNNKKYQYQLQNKKINNINKLKYKNKNILQTNNQLNNNNNQINYHNQLNQVNNQVNNQQQLLLTKNKLKSHHINTQSNNILPKINKSPSQSFTISKTRKLKTQNALIQRLNNTNKNKLLQYINIDTAIRQYRAGMTSLIKGVYYNPHNPYKN